MKIAIAGLGYVGTSNAVLLAQFNHVIAFDILQGKIDKINKHMSPVKDDMIDDFFESHNCDTFTAMSIGESSGTIRPLEYEIALLREKDLKNGSRIILI